MIKTRFAPSPTGYLHVGGLRTALYNFLFAKKMGGKFVLRIEDTDQHRQVPGAVENLLATLRWAGVIPDEGPDIGGPDGPYIQSQRLAIYQEQAQVLLKNGQAYYCFCSPERLEELKAWQVAHHQQPRYDQACRHLSPAEVERRRQAGEPAVIRMKIPDSGSVTINDLIRGKIEFPCNQLDDQVLVKSDGFPTYHLANVVDDHLMHISHVIRGEEWLPSTPKHCLLYDYFEWEKPQFAHLSLLLNPDKSKLSKRQGDVAVEDYRRQGYLPEALINYLALLGWNPGDDREIFALTELIEAFSLERVGKSGSVFDLEKLRWMNGYYIRHTPDQSLLHLAEPFFPSDPALTIEKKTKILAAVKDNLNYLQELPEKSAFLLAAKLDYQHPEVTEWLFQPAAVKILQQIQAELQSLPTLSGSELVSLMGRVAKQVGIKGKPLWMTLRCALTAQIAGPELHQIVEILDIAQIKQRVADALQFIQSHQLHR